MKIVIAISVLSLSFAFQPESVFANKVPTPERLQINNLPPSRAWPNTVATCPRWSGSGRLVESSACFRGHSR